MTAKFHDDTALSGSRVALMPGSFNPFTIGHLSILQRALPLFDRVIIVIGINNTKPSAPSVEERVAQVTEAVKGLESVTVMPWAGLTVDLALKLSAHYMIRGARTAADWEYEYNLATINRTISGIETIIIPTLPEHAAISSSVIRELEQFGHDASKFLP